MQKQTLYLFIFIFSYINAQQSEVTIDSILKLSISENEKTFLINSYKEDIDSIQIKGLHNFLLSKHFYKRRKYKSSLFHARQSLTYREKQKPFDTLAYQNSLYYIAYNNYTLQNFTEAYKYYRKVIQLPIQNKYTAVSYSRLANQKYETENFHTAIDYYTKSSALARKVKHNSLIFRNLISFSLVYQRLGDDISVKKGIHALLKAQKLLKTTNTSLLNQFIIYNQLGNLHRLEKNKSIAKTTDYYYEALNIGIQLKNNYLIASVYNNLGSFLNSTNPSQTKHFLLKGLDIAKDPNQKGDLLHNLSENAFLTKDYKKALNYASQSIRANLNITTAIPLEKIKANSYLNSNNKINILTLLSLDLTYRLALYQETKDNSLLKKGLQIAYIADQLLDHIRFEQNSDASKLFWQEKSEELYNLAIKMAYKLQQPEDAFFFMEKSKAVLLLENITDKQATVLSKLPDSIQNSKLQQQKFIVEAQEELYYTQNVDKKDSIQNRILDARITLHKFTDSLKSKYPQYAKLKKDISLSTIQEVQKQLDTTSILIEYSNTDDFGYGLAISKQEVTFFELENISSLQQEIQAIKSKIYTPFLKKEEFIHYKKQAHQLVQRLIPTKIRAKLNGKKIIIIPNHATQNLPFEALTIQNGDKTYEYLIENSEINYAYSYSFFDENQKRKNQSTINYIGYAPQNFQYDQLSKLPFSSQEVSEAASLFSGTSFIGDAAAKNQFLNTSTYPQILHLSTHATANDSIQPWIAFKDKKVFLNEIYNTDNTANLVVLSACKTALGETKKGEGVMSLARGFTYAGAKSVLSSIWNVNDKATQEILSSFYQNIKNGDTKSQALRKAKLTYLGTHSLSEKSPYYWSSLILIGDTGTINFHQSYTYWYYILIGFVLLTILITLIINAKKD